MLQLSSHMTAIATICSNPSTKFLGTNLLKQRYLNTSIDHSLSSSRLVFCGGFVANTMEGFVRTSAFRGGKSDEHVQVLEQEAFNDESSFRPKFLFHEVESILNRLVGVEWLGINEFTITSCGLAMAFGSYLSYLRVSQQLHTVSQVVVGAVIGSICSILWYWLWDTFMLSAFVSSLWVIIIIVLGSLGICVGFPLHVIRHWLKDK